MRRHLSLPAVSTDVPRAPRQTLSNSPTKESDTLRRTRVVSFTLISPVPSCAHSTPIFSTC
eukprot:3485605-Pleurochrysis_carterae.AAC.1